MQACFSPALPVGTYDLPNLHRTAAGISTKQGQHLRYYGAHTFQVTSLQVKELDLV